jgi:ABC-2 type transport system ATP-binding protein
MIKTENLTKYYGTFPAIQDVTFAAEKGEILGFLGPNAAGKTTTMRILTCFFPPTSGKATVAGYDVFSDSLEVRKRIGYLPETVPLYLEMNAASYLNFVGEVKGLRGRDLKTQVGKVIEECGVQQVQHRIIRHLSKGFRQRVGIAQALLHDPEVLILDEPTIGLDPKQIIEIRDLIKSLGGERTIILSTHILPEASMTCERVVIINEGRIVAQGTPESLDAQLEKAARVQIAVDGPTNAVREGLERVTGVTTVTVQKQGNGTPATFLVESRRDRDVRKDLARMVHERGWGLVEMKSVGMSLEDIYIKVLTREQEAAQQ